MDNGKKADIGFMKQLRTGSIKGNGLTRRQLMALGVLGLAGWMFPPTRIAAAAMQEDLQRVARIPQMDEREGPLLVFRNFVADPDAEVEQHIRLQLGQRKDLSALLRKKIGFDKQVRLSVEDVHVRLMFVPQLQENHAAAYYRYCLEITDGLFEMSRMDNIYTAITSPRKSYPPVSEAGISAFLVHRLAKAYRAICRFTAESGRSVKFQTTGAIFSNHLGAVELEIQLLAPGHFGLRRRPFSIWQNNSENLYTLMSIPVEETLHYLLGKATDRQITISMENHPPENLSAARRLAEAYMAVEESVVGGLVNCILARYCARHQMALPTSVTGNHQPVVPSLRQYRYRDRGIQLVQDLGFREAMAMYMDSPSEFKDQLLRQQDA